jgi:NADPH:quinone reductase-like Zn-dependent oxidoreductase
MVAMARTAAAGEQGKTMRALVRSRYGSPDVLQLGEVERPPVADDGVLVRVRASSVNRGDWYALAGRPLFARPMLGGIRKPKSRVLGTDFAGVVEAVGKDVSGFTVGDEVFGGRNGAFAEYVCSRNGVGHKPSTLSFEEAAAVPVAALTALQGLRDKGNLEAGQRVLINGSSGGVGTYAVQIAKALGAHVTAVCSPRNVETARSLGADRVIDYTQEDFTRSGERYDLLFDVAGSKPWRACKRVLKPGGTLVLVGAPMTTPILGPLGHIAAVWLASRFRTPKAIFFVAQFNREDMEELRELAEAGKLRSVIDGIYPLAEAPDALRTMGEGHVQGKLVITI